MFINLIRDFIYPSFCFFCKDFSSDKKVFCKTCSEMISSVVTVFVHVTKKYKVKVFAVSDYSNPVKSLILAKGSSDIVSSRRLGELIWELSHIKNVEFDYIVPIDLHWQRYAQRGFNQAQEMANIISKCSCKPVVNLLKRVKRTKRQSGLMPAQRLVNLSGAFKLNTNNVEKYKDKKILIVDDLMTTGSTIKSAARVLIELKPKEIIAVVACRVI